MPFETDITELFGYVAAGLVLGAFMMRTIVPLRVVAIASNVAFMTYGFLGGLYPVFILHLVLLPVNVYRLVEMLRLIARVRDAGGNGADLSWLVPYMTTTKAAAGTTLFRMGADADAMFLLTSGRVRLDEFDVEVGPGEVVGEMGVFSGRGQRTATAVCVEDCSLHRIAADKVRELALQNPQFGFYLVGIIADRLIDDLDNIKQSVAGNRDGLPAQA